MTSLTHTVGTLDGMDWWQTDPDRFWKYVDRSGDCWIWTGSRSRRGYGQISVRNTTMRAHRCAWELTNGPIPEGQLILHSCDNPPCCNPDHLSPGTHVENMRQMVERGRSMVGERHPRLKLSNDQVTEIRERFAAGATQVSLAAEFGVRQGYVSKIVRRRMRVE